MNSHLVTVEVGIERRTNERVKLNRTTLDEYRLECLNAESVKCRCTVKHYRVILDNNFKCVPNLGMYFFNHLSCGLDIACLFRFDKTLHNEGLEKLKCHFLGKTALIELKLRTDDDNRTAGIVNTLTEKVLTEASLLTLEHIGERLKRSVVRTRYRAASSAVVDKCVNGLLKHSLFVADNNIGCAKLKELFKAVVTVNNTAVKVVKVRCCKSAAVELNHGTDIRRNNRNNIKNHPLRLVARASECLNDLKTLESLCPLLSRCSVKLLTKLRRKSVKVNLLKKSLDSLCTHACLEIVLVSFTILHVCLFVKDLLLLKRRIAGIGDDVRCKVENLFEVSRCDVKNKTYS